MEFDNMGLFFEPNPTMYKKQNSSASPGMKNVPCKPKSWQEMMGSLQRVRILL